MSFKTISLILSEILYYIIWDQSFYIFIIDEATGEMKIAHSLRPVPSPYSMKEVELETSSFPWIITASLPFLSVKTPAVLLKLLSWYVLTSCSLTLVLWRLWYLLRALWSPTHRTITLVHFSNYHIQLAVFIFLWLVICSEFCPHFFLVTWLRLRHFIWNIKFRHLTFWPSSSDFYAHCTFSLITLKVRPLACSTPI